MSVTTGCGGIEAAALRSQIDIVFRIEALFAIPEYDHSDAQTFRVLVNQAVEVGQLDRDDVAAHFKISLGTLSRWIQGKNAPHRLARSVVTADLCRMLRDRRRSLEERLHDLLTADGQGPIDGGKTGTAEKPTSEAASAAADARAKDETAVAVG